MKSDFMLAINQLCAERKLSQEVVLEAVEAALISAYKRNFGAAVNIEVQIDPNSGAARVFAIKEVVEAVQDHKSQISVEEAREVQPDAQPGGSVLIESTPRDFGRIAAQTAKQVILQRIREAERDVLYTSFADRTGEIAHGTIQSVDFNSGDVIVHLEGGAEALLPAREQVPSERYRRGSRIRSYVLDVRRGNRGPQISLSRRSAAFLRRLMELEVPEIFNGSVEIKGIAREAGSRSKVAVHATQEGVDPVGSCVGVRGGRIQNVVNELGGEKIDVVQWDPDMATFIANSLSPARVMNVLLDTNLETGKTGTVIVPDRQLSLAIGKEGQNARLAAKLTGWRIDIKSASEAAEETLGRLEEAELAPEDMDLLTLAEAMLRKQDFGGLTRQKAVVISEESEVEAEDELEVTVGEFVSDDEDELDLETIPEEDALVLAAAPESEIEIAEVVDLDTDTDVLPADELTPPSGDRTGLEDEFELPFEGELIEDSLGWVDTGTKEDLYDGWGEAVEEADDWEPEPLWEPEEIAAESKKKRKKRRDRMTFEDLGSVDDSPRRRSRGR